MQLRRAPVIAVPRVVIAVSSDDTVLFGKKGKPVPMDAYYL